MFFVIGVNYCLGLIHIKMTDSHEMLSVRGAGAKGCMGARENRERED